MLNISSGLKNPTGARCYFNSVVIALLHFPKFVSWLEEHEGSHGDYQSCAACNLELLSSAYWDDKQDGENLETTVKGLISAINSGKLFGRAICCNTDLSVDNGWKK